LRKRLSFDKGELIFMKKTILVIDIGKTNKKILIYDLNLNMIDQAVTQIETTIENGLEIENIEMIWNWLIEGLSTMSKKYDVQVISVTTHGATCACIDSKGGLVFPVLSYTNDPGDQFHYDFFKNFGEIELLQKQTSTANFNLLLNLGKGIYFLKQKYPKKFDEIHTILNYPQYFVYLLTGKIACDPTFIGCHTYLWDFNQKDWSAVVDQMQIREKLPQKVDSSWNVIGPIKPDLISQTNLSKDVKVVNGIHDSNASLLPYLITSEKEFLLNSTGTWCVLMKESDQANFADDELGKTIFYNLNAFSRPVKTTIFMGGEEFQAYHNLFCSIHKNKEIPRFNSLLYQKIIHEQQDFILPSVVQGTGQFPNSAASVVSGNKKWDFVEMCENQKFPEFFDDLEKSYAVLNLSLVAQTFISMKRCGLERGMPVYIEGGFRKNDSYLALLKVMLPESKIFLTNLQEATAFGAAILAKSALEKINPMGLKHEIEIKSEEIQSSLIEGLHNYIDKLLGFL